MVRQPESTAILQTGYCGTSILYPTLANTNFERYMRGHFDTPQYATREEIIDRITQRSQTHA